MKKLVLFIQIVLVFICSCDMKNEEIVNDSSYSLIKDKEILVEIDDSTSCTPYHTTMVVQNEREFIAFFNEIKSELQFYSYPELELSHKTPIFTEGINMSCSFGGQLAFKVVDFDSIWVMSGMDRQLSCINKYGVIKKKINLDEILPDKISPFIGSSFDGFHLSDTAIYCKMINYHPPVNAYPGSYRGRNQFLKIDYLNSTIDTNTLILDNSKISDRSIGIYYSNFSFTSDSEKLAISFPAISDIISTTFEKNVEYTEARSKYVDDIPDFKLTRDLDVDRYLLRVFLKSPFYGPIIYDRYREVFYRFVFLGIKDLDEKIVEKGERSIELMDFSIQVLDRELKLIAESEVFDGKKYLNSCFFWASYFVSSDGLYISNNDLFHSINVDENKLKFTKFKLSKNE